MTDQPSRGDLTKALVIDGAAIATVDPDGREWPSGHVVVRDGVIEAVGPGPAPRVEGARRVDGAGCLLTPGLVNTHHHLYQWATRGYATESTLFQWLTELYPIWSRINEPVVTAAATAGLAWLARSGCTTSTDHHYLFPRGGGDLLAATVAAAASVGLRFHPTRGSMDLGRSDGGLPPDSVVEPIDQILAASAEAVERFHDARPAAMVRIGIAPCSPFSVSTDLLRESAGLARSLGVRLHTHLAETLDEEEYCRERHGCTPVEFLDGLQWLGPDVWLAHTVHLRDTDIARLAETGTGVAHCPSSNARLGAGMAPLRSLVDAGVPVGLGVDGAASQEAGRLVDELRQSVYTARLRGTDPTALNARQALALATIGGARCLGREAEIGSVEVGKLADLALWRIDGLGHAGIADPVTALVLGSAPPLELLTVGGEVVVERDELRTVDEAKVAADLRQACAEVRP
ncbi:MAG TPA: 8-oxoguanine deaminase [Micromonosporaceae bacterium]|nr:8-oxoguanine deaminase [Micromonosporaceae bacterium]